MRVFTPQSKATHWVNSADVATPKAAPVVQRAAVRGVRPLRFGYDFSRISVLTPKSLPIQAKAAVDSSGDVYEQEADRMADVALAGPMHAPVTGMPPHIRRGLDPHALRKPGFPVPPIIHDVLRSSGHALDPATRASMEPRFGRDFADVRVHTDAAAAESARAINSLAYTAGDHVVFAAGNYNPRTVAGKRLLAHELTHVV
jgi:hypothetical protein